MKKLLRSMPWLVLLVSVAMAAAMQIDGALIKSATIQPSSLVNTGTAGTYTQITTNAQGLVTAGATAPWPNKTLSDLNLSFVSTTSISVAPGYAVDSTNATNMTLASATTISTATAGLGGMDYAQATGTYACSNAGVLTPSVNGYNPFPQKPLTGTWACSAQGRSSGTTITGTGTKATSQLAVGDIVGNASTDGWSRVTAIASDTSITVTAAFGTFSGHNWEAYEYPVITVNGNAYQVTGINFSTGALTIAGGAGGTFSGKTGYIGWQAGTLTTTGSTQNVYFQAFLVVQSGTTSVVLSNGRTLLNGSYTSYRAVGCVVCDYQGNILVFSQTGAGRDKTMQLEVVSGGNNTTIVSAGTATTATGVVASTAAPPSARALLLNALYTNTGGAVGNFYITPRNASASTASGNRRITKQATSQLGNGEFEVPCDGAQGINYWSANANSQEYLYLIGWRETW